jgi:general stress protein 26
MEDRPSHRFWSWLGLRYRKWARSKASVTATSVLHAARTITRRKKHCLLATRSADGIGARVLQPWRPDDEFTVWLGTDPSSRKADELRTCARASLAYQDDRHQACVVLVGEALLVTDPEVCRRRFMPMWRAFFPEGPEKGFVTVRFTTERIELIDFSRHVTPEPFGLRAATLVRRDAAWVLE